MKREEIAAALERAAEVVESEADMPAIGGVVLASGLARLLDRLKADGAELHRGPHDVDVDDEGYTTRTEPDETKPPQTKLSAMKPFAILSAFRKQHSLSENMRRSARMLRFINNLLNKPGAYKLIGHWAEKKPEAADLPYKEALEKGLVEPTTEESLLIVKPASMELEDFESTVTQIGNWFQQDGILLGDGKDVLFIGSDGSRSKIGSGLTVGIIAKAYSRMRNKPDVPFVFAGTQQPDSISGNYALALRGIAFHAGVQRDEYKASPSYSSMLADESFKDLTG